MPGWRQKIRPGSCVGKHPPSAQCQLTFPKVCRSPRPEERPSAVFASSSPTLSCSCCPSRSWCRSAWVGKAAPRTCCRDRTISCAWSRSSTGLTARAGAIPCNSVSIRRLAFPCTGHDSLIFLLAQSFGWPSRGSAAPGRSICRPCWSRLFSAGSSPRCFCGLPIP